MRVLLSVFSIKILDRKDEQVLSKFGGNIDFINFFEKFTKHIQKNVYHWERIGFPKLSLTLPVGKKIEIQDGERCIYGHFLAGRDGDEFKVKDFGSGKNKVKIIRKKDSSLRTVFFYLSVPSNRKKGYLVLQVPEGKGIKNLLEQTLKIFFNHQGLQKYRVEISSVINEKIFYKMIDKGKLKELTFIKYGIPNTTDGLKNLDIKPAIDSGSIKTIYQSNDLGQRFKEYVTKIFSLKRLEKKGDDRNVIEFDNVNADELSVKIEFDGKQKTFHMENFYRTLPDIDVSNEVLDENKEIDILKMISQSKELINEVTDKIEKKDVSN